MANLLKLLLPLWVIGQGLELTEMRRGQSLRITLISSIFFLWVLLILHILLFKKHYIKKCVPVLTFGKK